MNAELLGSTVDRFRIVDRLGEGGMGEVYIAHDEILDRKVALKSIRRDHRLNPEARVRFLREARVLSQLRHPNICQIFDYVEGGDADFLVLELIHGHSLSTAMRGALSFRQKLQIAEQIAGALVAAHQKGIVHRDLKPDNVMLADGQVVKVLDFGLSRSAAEEPTLALERAPATAIRPTFNSGDETEVITDGAPTLGSSGSVTTHGAIMGTLGHMSPEQARGEIATTASDVYALGLVLQELFTGSAAYERGLDRMALLAKAQNGETLPVRDLDADLASLIREMEAVAPAARPAAAAVQERLRWIAEKPARRRRKVLVAAAVIALALFGAAMAILAVREKRATAAARNAAQRANREAETARQVSEFLVGLFKVADPGESRGNSVTARELLDAAAKRVEKDLQNQPVVQARMMDTIGLVYLRLGLYREAEPLLREGLAIRMRTLGRVHAETAQSMQNLGILYWTEARYDEAEPLFRDAIEVREKTLGPEHADLARSLNHLAVLYKSEHRYAEAEPLFIRSIEVGEKALGPDHPDLASSLNNLASFYFAQKKYAAAEKLLVRALAIKRKARGPNHPDVASAMNNIGQLLSMEGKSVEAEEYHARGLALRRQLFGPEHPDVAESENNLGSQYVVDGKLAEGEPLLEHALLVRRKLLGAEHPAVAETLGELAALRAAQHRTAEADGLYREAERIFETSDESELPSTLEGHAKLLRELGRGGEAGALEARAAAIRRSN